MAMPAYCSASNIRRSFHRRLTDALTVNTTGPSGAAITLANIPVFLDYGWADPEKLGAPHTPPPQAYVVLTWLDEMAGRGGASIVQVDVRVRIGSQTSTESDPFGVIVDAVADAVEEKFRGAVGGVMNGWVPIFDFTVPANPVQTDACLFIVNPSIPGSWGQPMERRQQPSSDGYRRITIRYSVNVNVDRLPGHTYMET